MEAPAKLYRGYCVTRIEHTLILTPLALCSFDRLSSVQIGIEYWKS